MPVACSAVPPIQRRQCTLDKYAQLPWRAPIPHIPLPLPTSGAGGHHRSRHPRRNTHPPLHSPSHGRASPPYATAFALQSSRLPRETRKHYGSPHPPRMSPTNLAKAERGARPRSTPPHLPASTAHAHTRPANALALPCVIDAQQDATVFTSAFPPRYNPHTRSARILSTRASPACKAGNGPHPLLTPSTVHTTRVAHRIHPTAPGFSPRSRTTLANICAPYKHPEKRRIRKEERESTVLG
ncbi:hypothetical protein DFH06DRAFT_63543 [Mycena polygramma]|nr:hypothetical protein DFH06DRAFT_63543 [Mycena polygramma]